MINVNREEKKYVITRDTYYKLRHQLSQVLNRDFHSEHSKFEHRKGEGYTIRSLYFDSIDDRDYWEKLEGIEVRRKCRLRTYMNDPSFCMLELKKKQGQYQKKTSLRLTREQGERLIQGDYSMLLDINNSFSLDCYQLMTQYVYRPMSVVTYEREAFVAKENKIRITFDQYIRGSESNFDIFSKVLPEIPFFDPYYIVLEVKYSGFLLQYIKDLLVELEKEQLSVSKYCLSRTVSKHFLI